MNRTIKFRLWDNEEKCYFQVGFLGPKGKGGFQWFNVQSDGEIVTGVDDIIDEPSSPSRWVLEQYTGLNDKNGVEIYEGDIVRHVSSWAKDNIGTKDEKPHEFTGFVQWGNSFNQGGWFMENSAGDHSMGRNYADGYAECEVIGNIHQNPELLT